MVYTPTSNRHVTGREDTWRFWFDFFSKLPLKHTARMKNRRTVSPSVLSPDA